MPINKVIYGNSTLLDLTSDTVSESNVASGKTFHRKDGTKVTGTAEMAQASYSNQTITLTNGFPVSVGGGGVDVTPLSVTENGTYTAPSGKAYSPVNVNVPTQTEVQSNDVNLCDYDGTILYSYSKEDFLTLTEFPSNPIHEGLVSQGWNWTLQGAKNYVSKYGFLDIGHTFDTVDGKTRLFLEVFDVHKNIRLSLGIKGTVTVDWGDDSEPITMTGSKTTTLVFSTHEYEDAGNYVITISSVSGNYVLLASSTIPLIANADNTSANASFLVTTGLSKIYVGSECKGISTSSLTNLVSLKHITIPYGTIVASKATGGNYLLEAIIFPKASSNYDVAAAFSNCYNVKRICISENTAGLTYFTDATILERICCPDAENGISASYVSNAKNLRDASIGEGVRSIGKASFSACSFLEKLVLPSGLTEIGQNGILGCTNIRELEIPASVTNVVAGGLQNLYSLRRLKFLGSTPPVMAATSSISGLITDCIIYVPQGSLQAYTTATNYPDSSKYTYIEY